MSINFDAPYGPGSDKIIGLPPENTYAPEKLDASSFGSKRVASRGKAFQKVIESGLWPENKPLSYSQGNEELEKLGYVRFYVGKNADLYIIPDTHPQQILMVRTDRTSVFDIPLDLEIEGKGAIQNQVALLGAAFARKHGVRTVNYELPKNIPSHLVERCQAIELCRPLEANITTTGGKKSGVELIFRNYLTGSLKKAYDKGENPYEVDLPPGIGEMGDLRNQEGLALFTPTTKDKSDTPIPSKIVEEQHPEVVQKLKELFREFTDFAYERGYVIVDTKFEVFINSAGEWCLGDEILTPESSRFIKKEDFEAGNYISADKQIIRNLGEEFGWKRKWAELRETNPSAKLLPVAHEVTEAKQAEVIAGYTGIYHSMKS